MNEIEGVLGYFEQISGIPRQTGHEQQLTGWLEKWAADRGLGSSRDAAGNLVIRVPGSPGHEDTPRVALQGHMDMVCERSPSSSHDFGTDAILPIRDGDWLRADGTTLGADNGIGLALALALADQEDITHPPLELLFTVEEEIGIGGAGRMDPALLSGRTLINLDSEEDGVFIVGCAGGQTTRIQLPVHDADKGADGDTFRLSVSGLQGGHSGTDIDSHRGNANSILARTLDELARQVTGITIFSFNGGSAHNAIPRSATAEIHCPRGTADALDSHIDNFERQVAKELIASDPGFELRLDELDRSVDHRWIDASSTSEITRLLASLPDGVLAMSLEHPDLVETSANLAVVELSNADLMITCSLRSMVPSRLIEVARKIEAIGGLAQANVSQVDAYPAWKPDFKSPLLQLSMEVYEGLFDRQPKIRTIHAGLECGAIGQKRPGMDMISMGPTIEDAHSPQERLYLPSVARLWNLLATLLPRLADVG